MVDFFYDQLLAVFKLTRLGFACEMLGNGLLFDQTRMTFLYDCRQRISNNGISSSLSNKFYY